MANQIQYSCLKIGTFRQTATLIFPSDDEGRARSAENFSMYNSISYGLLMYNSNSYGLLKKKSARSAEIFSILKLFFSILLKNRPESVCR